MHKNKIILATIFLLSGFISTKAMQSSNPQNENLTTTTIQPSNPQNENEISTAETMDSSNAIIENDEMQDIMSLSTIQNMILSSIPDAQKNNLSFEHALKDMNCFWKNQEKDREEFKQLHNILQQKFESLPKEKCLLLVNATSKDVCLFQICLQSLYKFFYCKQNYEPYMETLKQKEQDEKYKKLIEELKTKKTEKILKEVDNILLALKKDNWKIVFEDPNRRNIYLKLKAFIKKIKGPQSANFFKNYIISKSLINEYNRFFLEAAKLKVKIFNFLNNKIEILDVYGNDNFKYNVRKNFKNEFSKDKMSKNEKAIEEFILTTVDSINTIINENNEKARKNKNGKLDFIFSNNEISYLQILQKILEIENKKITGYMSYVDIDSLNEISLCNNTSIVEYHKKIKEYYNNITDTIEITKKAREIGIPIASSSLNLRQKNLDNEIEDYLSAESTRITQTLPSYGIFSRRVLYWLETISLNGDLFKKKNKKNNYGYCFPTDFQESILNKKKLIEEYLKKGNKFIFAKDIIFKDKEQEKKYNECKKISATNSLVATMVLENINKIIEITTNLYKRNLLFTESTMKKNAITIWNSFEETLKKILYNIEEISKMFQDNKKILKKEGVVPIAKKVLDFLSSAKTTMKNFSENLLQVDDEKYNSEKVNETFSQICNEQNKMCQKINLLSKDFNEIKEIFKQDFDNFLTDKELLKNILVNLSTTNHVNYRNFSNIDEANRLDKKLPSQHQVNALCENIYKNLNENLTYEALFKIISIFEQNSKNPNFIVNEIINFFKNKQKNKSSYQHTENAFKNHAGNLGEMLNFDYNKAESLALSDDIFENCFDINNQNKNLIKEIINDLKKITSKPNKVENNLNEIIYGPNEVENKIDEMKDEMKNNLNEIINEPTKTQNELNEIENILNKIIDTPNKTEDDLNKIISDLNEIIDGTTKIENEQDKIENAIKKMINYMNKIKDDPHKMVNNSDKILSSLTKMINYLSEIIDKSNKIKKDPNKIKCLCDQTKKFYGIFQEYADLLKFTDFSTLEVLF